MNDLEAIRAEAREDADDLYSACQGMAQTVLDLCDEIVLLRKIKAAAEGASHLLPPSAVASNVLWGVLHAYNDPCPDCKATGIQGRPGSYYDAPGKGKPCGSCGGTGRKH